MRYKLIPSSNSMLWRIEYTEKFKTGSRIVYPGDFGGLIDSDTKLPYTFYICENSTILNSDFLKCSYLEIYDSKVENCKAVERNTAIHLERQVVDRVQFGGMVSMTAPGVTHNVSLLDYGESFFDKFHTQYPLPEEVLLRKQICTCDIRQLMSTGHNPGCGESNAKK